MTPDIAQQWQDLIDALEAIALGQDPPRRRDAWDLLDAARALRDAHTAALEDSDE
jgi:hypothetical protein